MIDAAQTYRLAASFDWETLIPLVFFILYGLSQFLGSRKDKEQMPDDESDEAVDPMERARQIREEIRRKLEERRQAADPADGSPQPQPAPIARPAYDPRLPDSQQRRAQPQTASQPAPQPRPRTVVKQARPLTTSSTAAGIEKRLQEQRKRLADARQRQQEAKQEARKILQRSGIARRQMLERKSQPFPAAALAGPSQLRRDLLDGLRNPNSLRKAVLYREILGPPLGMR
jgi:hypothetical protein